MEKSFWGPSTWYMIHSVASGYKPEYRLSIINFINSLPLLLPCKYCREHLHTNISSSPSLNLNLFLDERESLFKWSYMLHDTVNKQLHKPPSPNYMLTRNYYFNNIRNEHFWGPHFWRVIHSFAAAYRPTPEVKQAFKQFIYSLNGLLPCMECKIHFNHNLKQLPLTDKYLESSHNLFLWSYLLHDLVNKQLNKNSPSFQHIKSQYFNDTVCSNCGT